MSKITALAALTTPAVSDVLPIVDVSDTSMAPSGTTKQITVAKLASVDWLNVTQYGADPTGIADSTTAIQNAVNALGTAGGHQTGAGGQQGGGVVYLPAGTYKVSSTITGAGGAITLRGDANWSTFIKYTGTGDCIKMMGPSAFSNTFMGGVEQLTIDGLSSTAPATGLHVGDAIQYKIDLAIQNFAGTGSIGLHLENTTWWTEQLRGTVYSNHNQSAVVFDVSGNGYNSFARTNLDVTIQADIGQDGVVLQNGAFLYDGALSIRGNFSSSPTVSMSNAVLRITGQAPGGDPNSTGYSKMEYCRLEIGVETVTNTHTPQTIAFGTQSSANAILACYGMLDFSVGGSPFVSAGALALNTFIFSGPVGGDKNLGGAGVAAFASAMTTGSVVYGQAGVNPASGNFFIGNADFFQGILSQSITMTFQTPNLNGPQRKTILLTQAASGGPYTVTWPKPGSPNTSSPAIYWAGGTAPTMSTGAGAIDKYTLETFDGIHWYGSAVQNIS